MDKSLDAVATISSAEARQHLSELISRTAYGKERIVLTRRGKGIVALVPVEDLDLLERIENLIDIAESDKALADVRRSGSVDWTALKAELNL